MAKKSAGIVLYRQKPQLEFLLVHPGGPFFSKKDAGVWMIPKGELSENEEPLACAIREFEEETGIAVSGEFMELVPVQQKGGKIIYAWALEGDVDEKQIRSNTFELEWPPKSGRKQLFPEIDKAGWFIASEAKIKINPAQVAFIDEVSGRLHQS